MDDPCIERAGADIGHAVARDVVTMKTKIVKVHVDFPERAAVIQAAEVLRQGGLVVFPTETVYGIAADAANPDALARLRQVKRRAETKPFSVMIDRKERFIAYTPYGRTDVYKVIDAYWPGPVTVVVPSMVPGQTIGIRIPDHRAALMLLEEFGGPVAAPSANIEGRTPPRSCEEALRDLDGLVDMAIDAGPVREGAASSIVDFTLGKPVMLREGGVSLDAIEAVASKRTVLMVCTGNSCRSVMAEYLLRHKTGDRPDVEVISAGTSVFVTAPASSGAVEVLRRRGIDASRHRSQPLSPVVVRKADLILVMTGAHRDAVLRSAPEVQPRVYLLREFIEEKPQGVTSDISDPIGQDRLAYEECAQIIEQAVDKVKTLL